MWTPALLSAIILPAPFCCGSAVVTQDGPALRLAASERENDNLRDRVAVLEAHLEGCQSTRTPRGEQPEDAVTPYALERARPTKGSDAMRVGAPFRAHVYLCGGSPCLLPSTQISGSLQVHTGGSAVHVTSARLRHPATWLHAQQVKCALTAHLPSVPLQRAPAMNATLTPHAG